MLHTALDLFAERGADAVSVRDVAAAAGVSPGLVVHHFGTKQALCDAVDDYVTQTLESMLSELGGGMASGGNLASVSAAVLIEHLDGTAIPAYLRRMLMDPQAGRALFRSWFELARDATVDLERAGTLRSTSDPDALAGFLLSVDLALFLLRDHLTDVLGADPLGPTGASRWAAVVSEVFTRGVFQIPADTPEKGSP